MKIEREIRFLEEIIKMNCSCDGKLCNIEVALNISDNFNILNSQILNTIPKNYKKKNKINHRSNKK